MHNGSAEHSYFTVGHSNRTIEAFLGLLATSAVEVVVDVRRLPGSRAHPQFNDDALTASLADAGLRYERIVELGGRRGRDSGIAPELNGFWENRSFHNYADYALGSEFAAGLAALRSLGRNLCCAIMCSEAVWWRCHRRIISDYLISSGCTVRHILTANRIEPAKLTPGARVSGDGRVTYPAS